MANDRVRHLTKRMHISELVEAGDFCFDSEGRVIMACPSCAMVFLCKHTVVQRDPLTLSPSVVGPDARPEEQVLPPCLHHFWVLNGEAIDISGGM